MADQLQKRRDKIVETGELVATLTEKVIAMDAELGELRRQLEEANERLDRIAGGVFYLDEHDGSIGKQGVGAVDESDVVYTLNNLTSQLAERDAELKDANARNADLTRAIADSAARTFEPHPAASLIERASKRLNGSAPRIYWYDQHGQKHTEVGPTLHAALTALAGENQVD